MGKIRFLSEKPVGRPLNKQFMTPDQYNAALRILNMSQETAANFLKISSMTSNRYACGKTNIPQRVFCILQEAVERLEDTGESPGDGVFLRRRRTTAQFKEDQIAKIEGRPLRWKKEKL